MKPVAGHSVGVARLPDGSQIRFGGIGPSDHLPVGTEVELACSVDFGHDRQAILDSLGICVLGDVHSIRRNRLAYLVEGGPVHGVDSREAASQ